jgi:hypothetical protein
MSVAVTALAAVYIGKNAGYIYCILSLNIFHLVHCGKQKSDRIFAYVFAFDGIVS